MVRLFYTLFYELTIKYIYLFFFLDELAIVNKNSSNVVCTSNLLMMIWSLQTISNSKKSGPLMVCAFVDLLGHFASVSLL